MLKYLLFAIGAAAAIAGDGAAAPCRFSKLYSCADFSNASIIDEYVASVMAAEGAGFHQPGIGFEPVTGYTYDGHPLNYTTGSLAGQPHLFSAPSKESLHVGMLAQAVAGNLNAQIFIGGADVAVDLLTRKMNAYDAFNNTFPGYGCFMPWVSVNSSGLGPTSDWIGRVPGLDNGEWAWALLAASVALGNAGESVLASRYEAYFSCMARNAKTIFYMGGGNVSSVVNILNMSAPVTPSNYDRNTGGLLNDPYEGETLTVLLDLYAEWDTPQEREQLWITKRPLLQSVNYTMQDGEPLTVQRGWWFSAHEQWKTMLLPYFDSNLTRVIFENCEKARTLDAAVNGIPGLFASVNDVTAGSINIPDYIGATGIASIAFEQIQRRDVVTPYGAWALMLHNVSAGLCWYNNMLSAPRMQGPHGSTEAVAINGTEICPLTTWDSKITTVLALVGGVSALTRPALQAHPDSSGQTSYQRFVEVISREYGLAFPFVSGGNAEYGLPTASVPTALSPWSSCTT
jgi:hypothetical protein